jgi:hypothetical protein
MFKELKKYGLMKYKDACYPRKISYYGIDEFFSSIRSKFRYFNLKPDDDSRALIQMLVDFFRSNGFKNWSDVKDAIMDKYHKR